MKTVVEEQIDRLMETFADLEYFTVSDEQTFKRELKLLAQLATEEGREGPTYVRNDQVVS